DYFGLLGGEIRGASSGNIALMGQNGLNFYVGSSRKMRFRTNIIMDAALDTNGFEIIGNSDENLKTNIVENEIDSLKAIMGWKMAGFDWKDTDKPQDRQFSVIAQSAKEISSVADNGYMQINVSKQLQITTHAGQHLALLHEETNTLASEAYINAETNAEKSERLEKEIQKLKEAA